MNILCFLWLLILMHSTQESGSLTGIIDARGFNYSPRDATESVFLDTSRTDLLVSQLFVETGHFDNILQQLWIPIPFPVARGGGYCWLCQLSICSVTQLNQSCDICFSHSAQPLISMLTFPYLSFIFQPVYLWIVSGSGLA